MGCICDEPHIGDDQSLSHKFCSISLHYCLHMGSTMRQKNTSTSMRVPGRGNSSLYESARLLAGVLVDNVQQFVVHRLPVLRRAGVERMGGAVRKMIAHQGVGHGAQRLLRRGDLSENVRAVAIVLNHALDSANLSFNPA